ncbi:MAG: hypothetical protein II697_06480, partial [Clostridia bacterium]|nr:hypothetical protein [Clostridia bacterium]
RGAKRRRLARQQVLCPAPHDPRHAVRVRLSRAWAREIYAISMISQKNSISSVQIIDSMLYYC